MFGKIFSILGGAIGSSFGGGILSTIGRFAGRMLGTYLEQSQHEVEEHHRFKNVKDSFALSSAMYGEVIPLIFGTAKVGGKIIWAEQIKEVRNNSTEKKYFQQFHQVKELYHTTECEYYLSFAVSICEGEIADVIRVWANDSLINLGDYKCRLYLGTEEQLPDSLIAASVGGQAPAFRDLSYIVFEELPLADFGSTVPNFSFEVIRKANIQIQPTVEDIVKSIVMIPGSGEFVYDTVIQHKCINTVKKIINSHNYKNIANSVYSLNQLQIICENVEWVAPVACWFGDSTDAGDCIIRPAIEFNDQYVKYSEEWQVAGYSRSSAKEISKDEAGNPRYGGSVNDASIVRYLQELKRRNLKIMFYPMVFLDIPNKPWRGHLTGTTEAIVEFFNKAEGYNNFILHYAELVKNYVDAFVIGSELIGLTKVTNTVKQYPAVIELIKLAERVKAIVGGNVLVTYAADWSEYHHTAGGWYNLDPLWASPYIDFIGIDAYFLVTRATNSNINFEDMVAGWQTGEGFDYYTDNEIRYDLAPEYAWKNLRYWWEKRHQNPDGMFTEWQPKMKQIWFTEFGFPSIDKATNQPNVFFDPNCVDGGVPRYSSGEIDFSIQRKAIKAFIEYWQSEEYIGQMFLWTWDARPYPAWPHMNIWRDGYLWEKGHWVNNKFGAASIAAIILELSDTGGLNLDKIDVATLDDIVEGVIFNRPMTIIDAINILRVGYFFDITATTQDKIRFIKRGQNNLCPMVNQMLVKLSDSSYVEQQQVAKNDIISKLELYFIDRIKEYNHGYCHINSEHLSNKRNAVVKLPIALSVFEAERLGQLILKNAQVEDKIIKFILPITNGLIFEPADFITFSHLNQKYQIRIVTISINRLSLTITGIVDDLASYYLPVMNRSLDLAYQEPIDHKFLVVDLPVGIEFQLHEPYVAIYLYSNTKQSLYVSLALADGRGLDYINIANNLMPSGGIGVLASAQITSFANIFLIDELSSFTIFYRDFEKDVAAGWNLALCGAEIIKFNQWSQIAENLYQVSKLIRGCFATESYVHTHLAGENFVLLNNYASLIAVSKALEQKTLSFKLARLELTQQLVFSNKSQKLLPPFIDHCQLVAEEKLEISWRQRSCHQDDWVSADINEKYEFTINVITENQSHYFTTQERKLIINCNELALSGEANISIIAQDHNSHRKSSATTTTIQLR